jgi:hypothetical protein
MMDVMTLCETGFVEKIPPQRTRSKYPWAKWEKTIMDNGGRLGNSYRSQ